MPPIDPRASKNGADYGWQSQILHPFYQQLFPQPPILSVPQYSAPLPSTQSYFPPDISVTQDLYLHLSIPQAQYHVQIMNPPSLIDPGTISSASEFTPNAGGSDPEQQVQVLASRPKPQCWDHGCNGREFSNFSNLIRHQREKSGDTNAECPGCGAVFTRTTNRNFHVSQGRCKGGRREGCI